MMKIKTILSLLFISILVGCSSSDDGNVGDSNCETPFGLSTANVSPSSVLLSWVELTDISSYRVEYGESGFSPGSGTTMNVQTNELFVGNLTSSTAYDFYVRSVCSAQSISNYSSSVTVTTQDCPKATGLFVNFVDVTFAEIGWDPNGGDEYVVEYGPSGFPLGSGTTRTVDNTFIQLDDLQEDTAYDLYVRTKCGDAFAEYSNVLQFMTFPACRQPLDLTLAVVGSDFVEFFWDSNNEDFWEIEYGETGFPLGSGTTEQASGTYWGIDGLSPNTTYDIYVRANCGTDGYSEYTGPLTFTTNP